MAAFSGSPQAITLQKALHARAAEIAANPLLSNGGRILNVLDPEAYGWEAIRAELAEGGFVALTMVDKDATMARARQAFGPGTDLPWWQAFTGTPDRVMAASADVLARRALPDGWRAVSHTHPDADTIEAAQALNLATGVAPQPGYFLAGNTVPHLLSCIHDPSGAMVACGAASMRYHPEGRLGGWIFAGGVSVAEGQRGKGLGAVVNARMLLDSHAAFGWTGVLEQARQDNLASVAMISACGLTLDPAHVTIAVNATGTAITR